MFSLSLRKKTNRLALFLPTIGTALFLLFFMLPSTAYMDDGPEVWVEVQTCFEALLPALVILLHPRLQELHLVTNRTSSLKII